MLESLHFQVPPPLSLLECPPKETSSLFWWNVILILAWLSLLILMSQLQCLQWLLNALSWQDAVRLHRVLLEWLVRWETQGQVEGNSVTWATQPQCTVCGGFVSGRRFPISNSGTPRANHPHVRAAVSAFAFTFSWHEETDDTRQRLWNNRKQSVFLRPQVLAEEPQSCTRGSVTWCGQAAAVLPGVTACSWACWCSP